MSIKKLRIGVLDIQGSVEEHIAMLKKLGRKIIGVKTKEDLAKVDGLIIPGGESTTIGKLLKKYGLDEEIKKRSRVQASRNATHAPLVVWGTCAGAILLAKKVRNRAPEHLGLMDIEIERNAYGRQLDSFSTEIDVPVLGGKKVPAIFIRAPKAKKTSPAVKVLAQYCHWPVMLRQNNLLATMFHPELTTDTRVHEYFISLVQKYAKLTTR